jgi:DNA-directed RNA polymerase I subunit RPA1
MTASAAIRTPTMKMPVLETVSEQRLGRFVRDSSRLTLSEVVEEVVVEERLLPKTRENGNTRRKLYTATLKFYPRSEYEEEYNVTPEQILLGIQRTFVPMIDREILKEQKQNAKAVKTQSADIGRAHNASEQNGRGGEGEEGEENVQARAGGGRGGDESEGDGDADDAKRASRTKQHTSYESDDEGGEATAAGDGEAAFEAEFASDDGEDEGDKSGNEGAADAPPKTSRSYDAVARMTAVEEKISETSRYVTDVEFDKKHGTSCKFSLEVKAICVCFNKRKGALTDTYFV